MRGVAVTLAVVVLTGCGGETTEPPSALTITASEPEPSQAPVETPPESDVATPTEEEPVPGRPVAPPVPSSPSEVRVSLGETASLRGVDVTVTDVFFDPCLDEYMQAAPGMTYLFADVTLTNRAYPGTANYGAFDWILKDGAGETYQTLISLPCKEPPSQEENDFLNEGVTAKTRLAYEVPGSARGLTLQWDGLTFYDDVARVLIDLGE